MELKKQGGKKKERQFASKQQNNGNMGLEAYGSLYSQATKKKKKKKRRENQQKRGWRSADERSQP